jgi:hypothetical protein
MYRNGDFDGMLRRSRRALTEPGTVLLLASDPLVIEAARDAARRMAGPPALLVSSDAEALSHLVGPGTAPRHLCWKAAAAPRAATR